MRWFRAASWQAKTILLAVLTVTVLFVAGQVARSCSSAVAPIVTPKR